MKKGLGGFRSPLWSQCLVGSLEVNEYLVDKQKDGRLSQELVSDVLGTGGMVGGTWALGTRNNGFLEPESQALSPAFSTN